MPPENKSASGFQNWEAVEQAVARSIEESPEQFEPAYDFECERPAPRHHDWSMKQIASRIVAAVWTRF